MKNIRWVVVRTQQDIDNGHPHGKYRLLCEPQQVEALDLTAWLPGPLNVQMDMHATDEQARPIREQCRRAGVPFYQNEPGKCGPPELERMELIVERLSGTIRSMEVYYGQLEARILEIVKPILQERDRLNQQLDAVQPILDVVREMEPLGSARDQTLAMATAWGLCRELIEAIRKFDASNNPEDKQ